MRYSRFIISILVVQTTFTAAGDYAGLDEQLEFSIASDVLLTKCVNVSVFDDKLVEHKEEFNVLLTTEDTNVILAMSLARVIIVDNDCKKIVRWRERERGVNS